MRQRLRHAVGRSLRTARRTIAGPEVSQRRIRRFLAAVDRAKAAERWPVPGSLAIVVPCYGHAAHLRTMFESIVRQTRPADEVLFVEDLGDETHAKVAVELVAVGCDYTCTLLAPVLESI